MAKIKYKIKIKYNENTQGHIKRYKFHYDAQKWFGNFIGRSSWSLDKEELLKDLRNMIDQWQHHDSILDRISDPVTLRNTEFIDATGTLTLQELLFNQQSLTSFLGARAEVIADG